MSPAKAAIALVLVAAPFAGGYNFLQAGSRPLPEAKPADGTLSTTQNEKETTRDPANTDEADPPTKATARSLKTKPPRDEAHVDVAKPLTCAEATKLGESAVGQQVSWTGKWIHTKSTRRGPKGGTDHVFETRGPKGDFTFDFPFVAEDTKGWEPVPKGTDLIEHHKKLWGPNNIVTVTGTIKRVETLIFINRGERYNVPVLTDITISNKR